MAQTLHPASFRGLVADLLCLLIIFPGAMAAQTKRGFSLELIHRDSPRSPLYPGKLTDLQRMQRLVEPMESQALSPSSEAGTMTIRPPMREANREYMVGLSIGTGPGKKSYYLTLDTGSNLTWTQCHPCAPRFNQSAPLFEPLNSPSYRHLSCDDPLCTRPPFHCVENRCEYSYWYYEGSNVAGNVSRETFTFHSVNGGQQSVHDLAFGCTHSSGISFNAQSAGILGMDSSPLSFAVQLASVTDGRFSYCLFHPGLGVSGYLRFGDDIVMRGRPIQSTPFIKYSGESYYYLSLYDISVNNKSLNIRAGTFNRKSHGGGGTVIDSGSSISYLIRPGYLDVREALERFFASRNLTQTNGRDHGLTLDLCYRMREGIQSSLPSMTFHFISADLHIGWQELFYFDRSNVIFCLAMKPSDTFTILGAYQQYNKRFTYDIRRQRLSFVTEDCSHDASN